MSDCRWWCEGNWLCWEETSPARCRDRAFDCSSNSRKRRLYDSTCQDETISQDFKDSRMSLHLLAQLGVLHHGVLLVELKAADAVKTFEIEPAAPSDAHSVQDHRRLQVQLQPTSCYSSGFDCQSRSVSIFCRKPVNILWERLFGAFASVRRPHHNFPNGEIIGRAPDKRPSTQLSTTM